MLALTRVSFKAVPLALICSRLFCGDVNNLRIEAQAEPACSPFSFRIQNARLKWRLFLCKQTCYIPCKLSDSKNRSLFGWKWSSISVKFMRTVFVHQAKRCVSIIQHRPTETSPKRASSPTRIECSSNYNLHTLTRASVRLVHMAISSRTAMSG